MEGIAQRFPVLVSERLGCPSDMLTISARARALALQIEAQAAGRSTRSPARRTPSGDAKPCANNTSCFGSVRVYGRWLAPVNQASGVWRFDRRLCFDFLTASCSDCTPQICQNAAVIASDLCGARDRGGF